MRLSRIQTTLTAMLAAMVFASSARAQPPSDAKPSSDIKPASEARLEVAADWVEITIVTDEPHLSLYAREPRKVTVGDDMGDSWSFVCDAPCGIRIDPRRTYRVMGEGIVPSIHFNLAPGAGRVALQVHPSRPGTRTFGAVLAVTGVVAALGGTLMFVVDMLLNSVANGIASESTTAQGELSGSASTYGNIGIGFLAAGGVLAATSLIFLLSGETGLTPAESQRPKTTANSGSGIRPIPFGFAF